MGGMQQGSDTYRVGSRWHAGVQVVKGGGSGVWREVAAWWHAMGHPYEGAGVSHLGWVWEVVRLHHVPDSFLNVIAPETLGQ